MRPKRLTVALTCATLVLLASAGPMFTAAQTAENDEFAITQGGECFTVSAFGNGSTSVEEFYDYRFDTGDYSSYGTTHLQENQVTKLFFYHGSNGTSLVVLHDKLGNAPHGSTATFEFEGLPNGSWAVKDDWYGDGTQDDDWNTTGSNHTVDWKWASNRTDGGAYRGLEALGSDAIVIDPHFNEDAAHWGSWGWTGGSNRIERFELLDNDGNATVLHMNETIAIEAGSCSNSTPTTTPTNSTPTTSTPTNSTPTNSTPTNSTPTNSTPTNSTPTNSTPTTSTPTNSTPTTSTPTNSTPTTSTPTTSTPTTSTPTTSTPTNSTPTTSTPTNSSPTPSTSPTGNGTPTNSTSTATEPPTATAPSGGGGSGGSGNGGIGGDDDDDDSSAYVPPPPPTDTPTPTPTPLPPPIATRLAVSDAIVGEPTNVTAEFRNLDRYDGNITATLSIGGGEVDSKTIAVPSDGTAEIPFEVTFESSGTFTVAVNDRTTTVTVRPATANLTIDRLVVEDSTIAPGETVTVTATVRNAGTLGGEMDLELEAFGDVVQQTSVTIPPDHVRTVSFDQRIDAPGVYTLKVNDRAVEVAVVESATETDSFSPISTGGSSATDATNIGIPVAVFAVTLLAALLAIRG